MAITETLDQERLDRMRWVDAGKFEKRCLDEKSTYSVTANVDGKPINIEVTPTVLTDRDCVPDSKILLVPHSNLVRHEEVDPKLTRKPVNIGEVGWCGPAISGLLLSEDGELVDPNDAGDEFSFLEEGNQKAVIIDGANRELSIRKIKSATPNTEVIVPFQVWDYRKLTMGAFEGVSPTNHDGVIKAALTGNLVKSKATRHGITQKITDNHEVVSPVACCQPRIRIPLKNLLIRR
jgi:hypothetical protein